MPKSVIVHLFLCDSGKKTVKMPKWEKPSSRTAFSNVRRGAGAVRQKRLRHLRKRISIFPLLTIIYTPLLKFTLKNIIKSKIKNPPVFIVPRSVWRKKRLTKPLWGVIIYIEREGLRRVSDYRITRKPFRTGDKRGSNAESGSALAEHGGTLGLQQNMLQTVGSAHDAPRRSAVRCDLSPPKALRARNNADGRFLPVFCFS